MVFTYKDNVFMAFVRDTWAKSLVITENFVLKKHWI